MSGDLVASLESLIGDVFAPLKAAAGSQRLLDALLDLLGHTETVSQDPTLKNAITQAGSLLTQLSSLDPATLESWDGIQRLLQISQGVSASIQSLDALENDPKLAQVAAQLAEELAALLLANYLRRRHETLFHVASFLTLVRVRELATLDPPVVDGTTILRKGRLLDEFQFSAVSDLLSDPWKTLEAEYLPNGMAKGVDAWAAARNLFPHLGLLGEALGLSCRTGATLAPGTPVTPVSDQAEHTAERYYPTFTFILFQNDSGQFAIEVMSSSRLHAGGAAGFVITPAGKTSLTDTFGQWKLTLSADGQIPAFIAGPDGFALAPGTVPLTAADAKLLIERIPAAGSSGPAFLFGSSSGTHLEVGTAKIAFEVSYTPPSDASGSVTLSATSGALVIAAGDGDSFLSSVLPSDGLRANFDLTILLSSKTGLSIRGGAGLDTTLPIGISLGPVSIPTLHLALLAGSSGLSLETSASISLSIGPLKALVDQIGLLTNITFPSGGGNLGPADFALGFKPPSGVGLSIDSAGVSGGGVLSFNSSQHEYSGILQLSFDDLILQAFGLITTQVAGGDGYSLLAMVDADFPPVQLGWGFTLDGVGGLLAVHRAADVDALRAAMKSGKLALILFPTNAITNGPLILAQLDSLFPTAPGRFLFGPMAQIGWGTPTLLTASVAVILELPEPIEIILLANLTMKLPNPSAPLIHVNMDALGVLDLSQGELSLDASLYDSKLITFTLAGDMALRANWSTNREFLLAIGGFHPQFSPPADFPALKRVTIDMPSGIVTKLRLAAYLAVTSNSLQFGAQLDVYIGVSGFGLAGDLGFDALLQFEPFHFEADISGSITLTAGGDDLMSVSLDATLNGPAPWNIAGKFKIHVIFFDVHVSFSQSWGEDAPSLPGTTPHSPIRAIGTPSCRPASLHWC
jgi:hypothetical protein